jgi:hypothetical protein
MMEKRGQKRGRGKKGTGYFFLKKSCLSPFFVCAEFRGRREERMENGVKNLKGSEAIPQNLFDRGCLLWQFLNVFASIYIMNFIAFYLRKIAFACFFLSFSIFSSGIQNYSLPEVLKVLNALEEIEREQFRADKKTLKEMVITESEFNSYVAYRIEKEKSETLKELHLKFFKRNKIEGKLLIDIKGYKATKFLKPRMTLYFGGKLEVKDGQARFNMKDLFLEGQRIQLRVIDLVLYIQAKIENMEVSSIKDWYEIPYGIKDIKVHRGKAVFYY